jgi:hypothetical protein
LTPIDNFLRQSIGQKTFQQAPRSQEADAVETLEPLDLAKSMPPGPHDR